MTSRFISFLFLGLFAAGIAIAQPVQRVDGIQYVSPLPGSVENSRESTIVIRPGPMLAPGSVTGEVVRAVGSISGPVTGRVRLSSDGRSLLLTPDRLLAPGETVDVSLSPGLRAASGGPLPGATFVFDVTSFERAPNPYAFLPGPQPASKKTSSGEFPTIDIEVVDSTAIGEGYIFLAVASEVEGIGYYLMMLENDGTPFFARELEDDYAYDFKLQPDGRLSYAHFYEHHSYTGGGNVVHRIMDESFAVVDSVTLGNGYVAEAHDFQILPNGHFLVFGYYLTPHDLTRHGGRPDALVSGGIVQELDADKNVIFQWRSWDYYDLETWPFNTRRIDRPIVSEFHLNTINLDKDGHILLATPTRVWKINRSTGDIIWRMGGHENEFSFVGVDSTDGVGMVGGHMVHRTRDDTYLLYDNGDRQGTRSSRAHEFAVDEENRTLELVWSFEPDSLVAGWHRGNAQRLPNGNTVIGWGGSSGKPSPAMTEVDPAGRVVYELSFVPPDVESYRAFRFPFSAGAPSDDEIVPEVGPDTDLDFPVAGVIVEIDGLDFSGYNEIRLTTYATAPENPAFLGRAPRVIPRRTVLDHYAVQSISGRLSFDRASWDIDYPELTSVFYREFEGSGAFLELPAEYNPAKDQVSAPIAGFGEYVLAVPDPAEPARTPWIVAPADGNGVNSEHAVHLEWAPVGYATHFDLQVARDEAFADLVVDERLFHTSVYELPAFEEGVSRYWRVRAINEQGTSAWSDAWGMTSVAPFVSIDEPEAGTVWEPGSDRYILWLDNLPETVRLSLIQGGSEVRELAITESDGVFEWEVALDLPDAADYQIVVESSLEPTLADTSHVFTIGAASTSRDRESGVPEDFRLEAPYPNPFNPEARVAFELPVRTAVEVDLFDVSGRKVRRLAGGTLSAGRHEVRLEAGRLPSGLYLLRLRAGTRVLVQPVILSK